MAVYIKINPSEIQNTRKNVFALQDSFSSLEKAKSRYKILEKEKHERIGDIRENLNHINILMEKIERQIPRTENPYLKTELTAKGIEVSPILELKTKEDYLKEFREISKKLREKK